MSLGDGETDNSLPPLDRQSYSALLLDNTGVNVLLLLSNSVGRDGKFEIFGDFQTLTGCHYVSSAYST